MSFSARNNAELVEKELTESNLRLFFVYRHPVADTRGDAAAVRLYIVLI